jgi:hypothetical protein
MVRRRGLVCVGRFPDLDFSCAARENNEKKTVKLQYPPTDPLDAEMWESSGSGMLELRLSLPCTARRAVHGATTPTHDDAIRHLACLLGPWAPRDRGGCRCWHKLKLWIHSVIQGCEAD